MPRQRRFLERREIVQDLERVYHAAYRWAKDVGGADLKHQEAAHKINTHALYTTYRTERIVQLKNDVEIKDQDLEAKNIVIERLSSNNRERQA